MSETNPVNQRERAINQEMASLQEMAAWKAYLKLYPYSLTEWRDTWTAFKFGWDAAMEIARQMVDGN